MTNSQPTVPQHAMDPSDYLINQGKCVHIDKCAWTLIVGLHLHICRLVQPSLYLQKMQEMQNVWEKREE